MSTANLRQGKQKSPRDRVKRAKTIAQDRQLTIYDKDKFFDAQFTHSERAEIKGRVREATGMDHLEAEFNLFSPVRREIQKALRSMSWGCNERLEDYMLIKICRDLEIDYKSVAKNEPKLPIDAFVDFAKRMFPQFRRARNTTVRLVQERELWKAWVDWRERACVQTGCHKEDHWLCSDRFVEPDLNKIADEVADYNATRPRLVVDSSALNAPERADGKNARLRLVSSSNSERS